MLLAQVTSTAGKIFFLLHIATIVTAFGPMLVRGATARATRIYSASLVLAGLFGILIVLVEDQYEFSQAWISASFLVWFLMLGVVFGMLVPAEARGGRGDGSAERLLRISAAVIGALFLVMLYLMIWKPGLS